MKKIISLILIVTITLTNSLTLSCVAEKNSARETYNSIVQNGNTPKVKKVNKVNKFLTFKNILFTVLSVATIGLLAKNSISKNDRKEGTKETEKIEEPINGTFSVKFKGDSPENGPGPSLNMTINGNLNKLSNPTSSDLVIETFSEQKNENLNPPTKPILIDTENENLSEPVSETFSEQKNENLNLPTKPILIDPAKENLDTSENETLSEPAKENLDTSENENLSDLAKETLDTKVEIEETRQQIEKDSIPLEVQPEQSLNVTIPQNVDTNSTEETPVNGVDPKVPAVVAEKVTELTSENKNTEKQNPLKSQVLFGKSTRDDDICKLNFFKNSDYFTKSVPLNTTFTNSSNIQENLKTDLDFDLTSYQEPSKAHFWNNIPAKVRQYGLIVLKVAIVAFCVYRLVKMANKLSSPKNKYMESKELAGHIEKLGNAYYPKNKYMESEEFAGHIEKLGNAYYPKNKYKESEELTERIKELGNAYAKASEPNLQIDNNLGIVDVAPEAANKLEVSSTAQNMEIAEAAKKLSISTEASVFEKFSKSSSPFSTPKKNFDPNEVNLNSPIMKEASIHMGVLENVNNRIGTPKVNVETQVDTGSGATMPSQPTTPKAAAKVPGTNVLQTPTKLGSPSSPNSPRRFSYSSFNLYQKEVANNFIQNRLNKRLDNVFKNFGENKK